MVKLQTVKNMDQRTASMLDLSLITMEIKIATLNLCLGIQAKKNLIKETILFEKIDILSMQETEINKNLDCNLLSFPGYPIETVNNSLCLRVAFYISSEVNYIRRRDLEGVDSNVIIKDIEGEHESRLLLCTEVFHLKIMFHIMQTCQAQRGWLTV